MYHNLINNVHVLFVHVVHIIVNRIKIEIRHSPGEEERGKFVGDYFRKNLWIIFKSFGIFTVDTSQILLFTIFFFP